jgi:hypothetical protein
MTRIQADGAPILLIRRASPEVDAGSWWRRAQSTFVPARIA